MPLLRVTSHQKWRRAPELIASLINECAVFKCGVRFVTETSNMVETAHAQWKIAKIGEKQRRAAKISTSQRKSMSLNPFPVSDLQPEVELLMHFLCIRRHYCHVWNRTESIGQTPEFAWALSCSGQKFWLCMPVTMFIQPTCTSLRSSRRDRALRWPLSLFDVKSSGQQQWPPRRRMASSAVAHIPGAAVSWRPGVLARHRDVRQGVTGHAHCTLSSVHCLPGNNVSDRPVHCPVALAGHG